MRCLRVRDVVWCVPDQLRVAVQQAERNIPARSKDNDGKERIAPFNSGAGVRGIQMSCAAA